MRLYPDVPSRRAATLVRDAAAIVLLVVFALIGKKGHDLVDTLSVLGSGLRDVGEKVPLVGDPDADAGKSGEDGVHRLANALGLIVFGLPAAVLLAWFLPPRLRQVRALTAADRVLRGAEPRAIAMRAAFSLPYGELLRFTRDPLGDLEAGRYDPLVAAALDDAGLRR